MYTLIITSTATPGRTLKNVISGSQQTARAVVALELGIEIPPRGFQREED